VDARVAKQALRRAASLAVDVDGLVRVPAEATRSSPAVSFASAELGHLYDLLIDDPDLNGCSHQLFENGHYAQAVEEAFKFVNNLVKQRSGLAADGSSLMNTAFSANAPVLKLSKLTTQSQRDQQLGYMQMLSGAMVGIRNPRAHEHGHLEEPRVALELMCFANHLVRAIKRATRARKGK